MSISGTTWSVLCEDSSLSSSCTTQGWRRTSSELILSLGSRRMRFLIKHLALFDTVSGILKFPRLIFLNKFVWSKSLKGYLKKKIKIMNTIKKIKLKLKTFLEMKCIWLVCGSGLWIRLMVFFLYLVVVIIFKLLLSKIEKWRSE